MDSVNIHLLSGYHKATESEHQWRPLEFWCSINALVFSKRFFTCLHFLHIFSPLGLSALCMYRRREKLQSQLWRYIYIKIHSYKTIKSRGEKVGAFITEKYWGILWCNPALQRNQLTHSNSSQEQGAHHTLLLNLLSFMRSSQHKTAQINPVAAVKVGTQAWNKTDLTREIE